MRLSVIVPVKNEGRLLKKFLLEIASFAGRNAEVLIVLDSSDDPSYPTCIQLANSHNNINVLIGDGDGGPAEAIKLGFSAAKGAICIVCMADGCDDYGQIPQLATLVERGTVVACASRYMPSGQQVGGPRLKRALSRFAGKSFHLITGVGTHDATNSFKAYDTQFVRNCEIHSQKGFEIGLELVAKARRLHLPVAEIPTTWIDQTPGKSNFALFAWLPEYIRWYLFGVGLEIVRPEAHHLLSKLRSSRP